MRSLAFCLFLFSSCWAHAETIQKWTDDSGLVHYGDTPPAAGIHYRQRIEIHSSYDEQSYKQAMKRNTALYKDIKKIEKKEKSQAIQAEKRLDDYFKYLDKKDRQQAKEKARKRRYRDNERDRASIKIRRGQKPALQSKKPAQFGL